MIDSPVRLEDVRVYSQFDIILALDDHIGGRVIAVGVIGRCLWSDGIFDSIVRLIIIA